MHYDMDMRGRRKTLDGGRKSGKITFFVAYGARVLYETIDSTAGGDRGADPLA